MGDDNGVTKYETLMATIWNDGTPPGGKSWKNNCTKRAKTRFQTAKSRYQNGKNRVSKA